jgi:hypothetical protein
MNTMNLFLGFVLILVIGFFAVGFTSSIAAPDPTTAAGQQYTNLSVATGIAGGGMTAVMLILVLAMVISALFFVAKMVKK